MRCDLATLAQAAFLGTIFLKAAQPCYAQNEAPAPLDQQRLDLLNAKLDRIRAQMEQSLAEIQDLTNEVQSLRGQAGRGTNATERSTSGVDALREEVAAVRDQTDVLQSEVKQHDQTKVESLSKYPVRISGTLLFTSFLNSGDADDFTLPVVALPKQMQTPSGSLGFTASQTVMQIELRGPSVGSAHSHADLAIDFWGTSNNSYYAAAAGAVRLRTLHAGLTWEKQALGIAVDRPMFSPVEPSSWLTVAEPAFAWSGNLWTWLPQVEYARYLLPRHQLDVQVGIIDTAAPSIYRTSGEPAPNAAERSRQPGYQARVSTRPLLGDRQATLGASGYYSRKSYTANTHVDAWAVAADWQLPLTRILDLSGELYRGRAIGGLGGGAFKDYVTSNGAPYGLNAAGGWAEMKFGFTRTLQANLSFGLDNAFARDLADADTNTSLNPDYTYLARNQTGLINVVYRPRSYLLLSPEFRHIVSRSITGQSNMNNVLGIATGVTF